MPLSAPAERELLHRRDIEVRGYRRTDGLFDIEAHLTDRKSDGFDSADRGWVAPGEPLHEMRVRLVVDEAMVIQAAEAVTEHGPFLVCPGGAESFTRLAGLTIKSGFLKAAAERLGGTQGCTHIRELLQQVATTAFQTLWSVRIQRERAAVVDRDAGRPSSADGSARLINTCHAYADTGPVVRRRWPHLYKGPAEAPVPAEAPGG